MWPKQAQFMVWVSVRVSDCNLPHWKAGIIAFALAIAMRGETRTQVVYRFVSFLSYLVFIIGLFPFCFVLFCFFMAILFLFSAKNIIELHIWQWFLTDRTLLHSQSWVNLPFCFLYGRKNKREREREREREKRLKEWISRPKHKKPVALGHPPNHWDVFLATSGDTIPCTTFGLFGRDTTAFKRLNAQVVSSTLVLGESIHDASQIYIHQFSKETFHADGSNSNQFSAISSVTSPFSP